MLEKVVAAAVEGAPAIARLTDEAFALMRAPVKTGIANMGTEVKAGDMVGTVFATDTAKVAHFPGHSTVHESTGHIHLLSADGAKLHLTPTQARLELVDGTIVSQEGLAVTTRFPSGDILRQEKLAQDHVVTTFNGKALDRADKALPDGASLSLTERHASSVFLKDGTYVGNNTYGFSIFRGVDPTKGWRGGQAEISVEAKHRLGSRPFLALHDAKEYNMFQSNFLLAKADSGVAVRIADRWTKLSDLLKV